MDCPRACVIAAGRIELIGSGYSQMIGPLVPARVTAENLRLGNAIYEKRLGTKPRLALVNEQAYSAGLVGLYLDAGYHALIMDYDNPAAAHPEWPAQTAFRPARAQGTDDRSIALIWSNTTAFQQLQRFAHGDITLEAYGKFVRAAGVKSPAPSVFMPAMRRFSISAPAASAPKRNCPATANGPGWAKLSPMPGRRFACRRRCWSGWKPMPRHSSWKAPPVRCR